MKHSDLFRTAAAAALSLVMAAVPAVAKNNNAKVKPVVAKPASASSKAKVQTPKAQAPKAAKAQAPKAKAQTPKAAGAASTKSSTRSASTNASSSKAARNTPTLSAQPLSKAQQKLLANETLRLKMQTRLPRGMDPMLAASGFKNLGQFVAAVNVSNNLGIDFTMLKGMMVNRGMSLGQAIQTAKALEARRANSLANTAVRQADDEITATSLASVTATKRVKDKS